MTLTQLSYVVALAEKGHFGRAAEACNISQPTLSAQIQKLEQELGAVLFDRSFQPVRTTEHGERFVNQARAVLAERDHLVSLLDVDGDLVGELRVGIIPTLSTYLLPIVMPAFAEQFPQVELSVQELTTSSLMERIVSRELDAGLVATVERRPGVDVAPLFREAFVAYVSDNHQLAAASSLHASDLVDVPLWLLTEGHCLRDQVLELCERAEGPCEIGDYRVRFESGNLETLRHMVDRLGGITLLPQLSTYFLDPTSMRRVRTFDAPAPYRQISLVSRRAGAKRRMIEAFSGVIIHTMSDIVGHDA